MHKGLLVTVLEVLMVGRNRSWEEEKFAGPAIGADGRRDV